MTLHCITVDVLIEANADYKQAAKVFKFASKSLFHFIMSFSIKFKFTIHVQT